MIKQRKKIKESVEELVDKLVISIEKRNPGKKLSISDIQKLTSKWRGHENELKAFTKTLAINEHKVKVLDEMHEQHIVEFQLGVSLSGEPIMVRHEVERLNVFKKTTGRYTKKPKGDFDVKSKAFVSRVSF